LTAGEVLAQAHVAGEVLAQAHVAGEVLAQAHVAGQVLPAIAGNPSQNPNASRLTRD